MDDQTVKFTLNSPNPRFIVENFGVRIFGSFLIIPEHIWNGEDAATFAFNPPIGTGPYTFTSAASKQNGASPPPKSQSRAKTGSARSIFVSELLIIPRTNP